MGTLGMQEQLWLLWQHCETPRSLCGGGLHECCWSLALPRNMMRYWRKQAKRKMYLKWRLRWQRRHAFCGSKMPVELVVLARGPFGSRCRAGNFKGFTGKLLSYSVSLKVSVYRGCKHVPAATPSCTQTVGEYVYAPCQNNDL